MYKVRLGRTELMVSAVGLGGIPIQRPTEEEAVEVVRRCLDLGVNFIDTANMYGNSEERMGRAIAGRREGLILATKSHARQGPELRQHLELSLKQLGVDYIDLYQLHNVSNFEDYEKSLASGGPLDVVREAQAAGQVGHIGITGHSMEVAPEAIKSGFLETMMFPFNFVSNEAAEKLIPLAREHDVGFIVMKPMGGGLLENATVAFKYLRRFPDTVPIVGIEKAEEIEEIIAIMEGDPQMTPVEEAEMDRLRAELGTRFCRRCGYCQPCPEDVPIQMIMILESMMKRVPAGSFFPEWGTEIVPQAENCVQCGECEEKCPYHLPIREMMEEHLALFHTRKEAHGFA
ncbi:MAG: aldo/keto reductase [Anaerolineae bacterium]